MRLLKFELALRSNSPKIQMFQQIAKDRGVDELNCDTVIDVNGHLSCDFPENLLQKKPSENGHKFAEIEDDHRYIHYDDHAEIQVVLYAKIGTKKTHFFHEKLKHLASQGKIKYIFRHFLANREKEPKLRLSGYGVELQIKSSEYKAQDDRKVSAEKSDENNESDDNDNDKHNEINGFNFDILTQKYPDEEEKLGEFKQFLLDENNPMAPLKVWQLQDLSLQTVVRVLNSPKDKQLSTLSELASNFPSYARPLSKTSVPKEIKKEVKNNRDVFYEKMSLQPSDSALFINGLQFDMAYVDIFTVLDTIKTEAKVLDGLGRLGLTDDVASKMTSMDFKGKKTKCNSHSLRALHSLFEHFQTSFTAFSSFLGFFIC